MCRKLENVMETCFICQAEVKHAYLHVRNTHKDRPDAWKEYQHSKILAKRNMTVKIDVKSDIESLLHYKSRWKMKNNII